MSDFKKLCEEGMKMRSAIGQRRIADWVMPNDDGLFDNEAKAEEYAGDAEAYVELIAQAHREIHNA